MCPDAPYLLSLMPDDFTRQGKASAHEWVREKMCEHVIPLASLSFFNPLAANLLYNLKKNKLDN